MKKIHCLVADDEKLARSVLESFIERVEGLELIKSCSTGSEVFTILQQQPIDLLFLDIRMPNLSGMEVLKAIPLLPPVIMTTAYSEYALESYQFNVIDYLLKPISFERFMKAIGKYNHLLSPPRELSSAQPDPWPAHFIYVRSEKKMIRVVLNDLLYIEGVKDYVRICLRDKTIITHQTLSSFESRLPSKLFLRVHRSFIINLQQIESYTAKVIEIGKQEIPIGESYSSAVLQLLKD